MPERIARISGAEVLGFKCYRAPPTTDHIFASGSAGRVIEQHHDDRLLRPLSSLPSPKIAALVCQWQHWGSCTAALPHVTKVCFGPVAAFGLEGRKAEVLCNCEAVGENAVTRASTEDANAPVQTNWTRRSHAGFVFTQLVQFVGCQPEPTVEVVCMPASSKRQMAHTARALAYCLSICAHQAGS